MWGLINASAVFIVLWAAGSAARRFFAHWLSGSIHLTYSDGVLKAPEPACIVTEFGDSNVMFEVRFWIEDPRSGIGRVRSRVLLAIWDTFHANGIQFAFPQRDLHIIDGLPNGPSA